MTYQTRTPFLPSQTGKVADHRMSPAGQPERWPAGGCRAAAGTRECLVRRNWDGADDHTAAELVRRRLVDLPLPGSGKLILGRHIVRAIDLGCGNHMHEIVFVD